MQEGDEDPYEVLGLEPGATRDQVERAYRWMDAQLGRLVEALPPDTTVMVVSDHGSLPIRRLAYLNAWLRSAGGRNQP